MVYFLHKAVGDAKFPYTSPIMKELSYISLEFHGLTSRRDYRSPVHVEVGPSFFYCYSVKS